MDAASIATATRPGGRLLPALELAAVVGLLEWELWSLRASGPAWLVVGVYGAIVAVLLLSHDRRRRAGSVAVGRVLGPGWAWVEALVACAGLSALLVIAATYVGDPSETFEFLFLDKPRGKLATWLLGKLAAALVQQLALQTFLWPVCSELAGGRRLGAGLAAAIFGLIHLPSPTLVAITVIGGLAWVTLHRRSGRVAPLVFCHMVVATVAHGTLPERLTYDMRVGATAGADARRWEYLKDPRARLVNRRLKEARAELRHYASDGYYAGHGGDLAGFLRGLYGDILDRPMSREDLAYWLGREFDNPRVDITNIFLGSDECDQVRRRRRAAAASAPPLRR